MKSLHLSKKKLGLVIAVATLVIFVVGTGPTEGLLAHASIQAYDTDGRVIRGYVVTGDVTSGWGTDGGNLWYDVLKENATSSAGGYGIYSGVIVEYPNTPQSSYPQSVTASNPNPVNPTDHNWIEGDYILVTGWYGQSVLYSVGEIDPRFGNGTVTLTLDNGNGDSCYDSTGLDREVTCVSTIDVVHAFTVINSAITGGTTLSPGSGPHPYSPTVVVSGAGINPVYYNLTDLLAMPSVTLTSVATPAATGTGPTLLSVLEAAGIDTTDRLGYVIVQATDGYATLLSMYEVRNYTAPCLTGTDVFLAVSGMSGTVGSSSSAYDGAARLVFANDLSKGRWVSNVAEILVYYLSPQGMPISSPIGP